MYNIRVINKIYEELRRKSVLTINGNSQTFLIKLSQNKLLIDICLREVSDKKDTSSHSTSCNFAYPSTFLTYRDQLLNFNMR